MAADGLIAEYLGRLRAASWPLPATLRDELVATTGAVFLPFLGPLVGLLFLWASRLWTTREKAIGTGIVLVVLALPIVALLSVRIATAGTAGVGL